MSIETNIRVYDLGEESGRWLVTGTEHPDTATVAIVKHLTEQFRPFDEERGDQASFLADLESLGAAERHPMSAVYFDAYRETARRPHHSVGTPHERYRAVSVGTPIPTDSREEAEAVWKRWREGNPDD